MVNPGGLEPPAAGLKVPCPADPGFTLGVHDPAFVRRHLFLLVWCTREVLPLLSDGYRPPPSLLRLTCALVRRGGNDPPASAMSRRCSAAELTTPGAPSRIRTSVLSVC